MGIIEEMEAMIKDYQVSLTCGYMGIALEDSDELFDEFRKMKPEEIENIILQLTFWCEKFSEILLEKKGTENGRG